MHYAKNTFMLQWLFLVSGVVLFGTVIGIELYGDYTKVEAVERDRLVVQAKIIHENLNYQLRATNLALQRIRGDLPLWWHGTRYSLEATRQMETFAVSISGIRTLIFMDAAGTVRLSNRSELMNRNFSFRDYFRVPSQRPNDDILYLSPPFQSALSVFVMNLSRVVIDAEGGFSGVVTASLEPEYFKTLMDSVLYAPDMQVSIFHGDGTRFLRVPELEASPARTAGATDAFFAEHRESGRKVNVLAGMAHARGEVRMAALYTIQPERFIMDKPLVIKVSRRLSALYADFRKSGQMYGGLFVVLASIACLLLMLYQIRTRRLDDQARHVQEALRESEQRLRDILNHTTAIVFMKDLQGRYLFINRQYEELFQITHETLKGQSDHALFPEEVVAQLQANDRAALASETSIMVEECLPLGDDVHTYIAIKFPLRDNQGQPYAVCGIATDITARKQMEEQLRTAVAAADAANRAKSDFLSTMSHEIRTPMNGVLGMAELLMEMPLSADAKSHASAIRNSGRALLGIINDILDFSKIEAGKIELEEVDFSLHELLKHLTDFFAPSTMERGIAFHTTFSAGLPSHVRGDPTRLRQVLTNLLSNAIKFTQEGGVALRVQCGRAGGGEAAPMVFRIQDTGVGIHPESFAKLFKSFEQADSSTTRRFGGTGLGLAISRRLVTLMRGTIEVESTPGQGSLFTVTLPLPHSDPHLLSRAPTLARLQGAQALPPGMHLLIVEDDATNRAVLHGMLKQHDMRFDFAENGLLALEKLWARRYDLVFMDCQMPELDGFATCQAFRKQEQGRRTPVVALTAYALKGDRERCLEAGMDDYLTKPIDRQRLVATLVRWLVPADRMPPALPTSPASSGVSPPDSVPHALPPDAPGEPHLRDVVDRALLHALRADLDAEDFSAIVASFLTHLPARLDKLRAAHQRPDPEALRHLAHTLKGASRQLGALNLGALCERLETLAQSGSLDQGEKVLAEMDAEAASVQEILLRALEEAQVAPTYRF